MIYIYSADRRRITVEYGKAEALIVIGDGSLYAGSLPPRALRMVRQWRRLHVEELQRAWQLASAHQDPGTIEPLP